VIRDHLGYLWSVAKEFKALLGGSSIVVVAAGLYEHYTQSTLHWIIYLWIVLLCGFIALFMSGVRSYRRLQPRLYINAVPILQEWQTVGHIPCRTMFFEIRNLSEATTVENVSVDLFRISPEVTRMNWLPVRLHVKHDNPMAGGQYVDHFSLNPKETKHIDLASLAESVLGNLVNGIKVEHVVNGANQHIPVANYDFTVVASGKDTPAITTVFKIRVKDGKLSYE
jgi:hypothetical protein